MHPPAIARALGGRVWSYSVLSVAALSLTALFGVLVDAGWTVGDSFLGAAIAASLLGLGGILLQQRVTRQGSP